MSNRRQLRQAQKKNKKQKQPFESDIQHLITLFTQGNYSQALPLSREMTSAFATYGFGWKLLGSILKMLDKNEEALEAMQKALNLMPNDAEINNTIGVILLELGRAKEAEAYGLKAVKIRPDYAGAYNNLANTLKELQNLEEAEICYRKTIELEPNFAQAYANLGDIRRKVGKLDEAKSLYLKAVELNPNFAEPYRSLAYIAKRRNELNEAENYYRKLIELRPDDAVIYNNLGNIFRIQGRVYEAKHLYLKAINLQPDYAVAYSNLGGVSKELGDFNGAQANYTKALQLKPDYITACSNLLGTLNYNPEITVSHYLKWAKKFQDLVHSKVITKFETYPEKQSGAKLRIGFVSGDFKAHPVGYILESFLPYVKDMELLAYSANEKEDEITAKLKQYFTEWNFIYGVDDKEVADMIYKDKVDILIDLSGHTANNCLSLFAYKPAPISASWLGYFATTGLSEIDYFIGDKYVMSEDEDKNFVEKLYRLEHSWLCFPLPKNAPAVANLPALENKFITFGCFGNLSKVNDEVIALWSKTLLSVNNSKLFLKAHQLGDKVAYDSLLEKFKLHGIARERLILEAYSSMNEYFSSYNKIDIVLDTFPYHGGTTSVDAVYMGVPVLSLKGDRFLSKIGESIIHNINMKEWIAENKEEFIDKAIDFSLDIKTLAKIRAELRRRVTLSPLYNGKQFAENFEKAMMYMQNNRNLQIS